MSSLPAILVNRLVLNLRERAVQQLPTTVETVGKFQAALPVLRQPLPMTSIRNPSFVRQNRLTTTVTATHEPGESVSAGESHSQQVRTMDVIGHETKRIPQAALPVRRQQPGTSGSVRSLSFVGQNGSIAEMTYTGTSAESRQSADAADTHEPRLTDQGIQDSEGRRIAGALAM